MVVLSRRLEGAPDPLGLYAAAKAGIRGPGALFETADAGAGESARSLIFLGACASLGVRDGRVRIRARGPFGAGLLDHVAERLSEFVVGAGEGSLDLRYPPAEPGDCDEAARLRAPSVLDPLREFVFGAPGGTESDTPAFAYGCFAYDLLGAFERLPEAARDPTAYPDCSFHLAESVIRVDHRSATTTVSTLAPDGDRLDARRRLAALADLCRDARPIAVSAPGQVTAQTSLSDADYAEVVERAKMHIAAGDVYQIVPSRAWEAPCADPLGAYARLRAANPSPYMFYLDEGGHTLFGASPEGALKVGAASRRMALHPIAGTRPRGRTAAGAVDEELDARLELELRLSEKEIAEHVMLVDLARNDIARIAVPGSRRVVQLMQVERYSHVMHLVSRVAGELAPGLDALHAYRATLNMGTLTGAPKLRAAELLRRYEPARRGPYGGAVGYLAANGDLDTAIVIRSALVRDGIARVQAGAGVVADSDPYAEADETRRKAQAVLAALGAREESDDE